MSSRPPQSSRPAPGGAQAGATQQQQRRLESQDSQVKSYQIRLKESIKMMLDSLTELLKISKVDDTVTNTNLGTLTPVALAEFEQFEGSLRATNFVRGAESLLRLVHDLKMAFVLNDFPTLNESMQFNSERYRDVTFAVDAQLVRVRDELVAHLNQLELEFYTSAHQ